ncbi:MAG: hypothetical protein J6K45_04670 [Clostridia bacterium]|nr:hypothetical protein [Clostridia bacterium]
MNGENQNNEGQKHVVTQTANTANTNKTEETVTQTESKTEVKTFTQEEVNGMLAKERKNMPSKEEMKAFREWQESQKTEEQKKQEEIIKNQKLQEERDFNSQIIEVMKKGLDYDTAEFVQFKVSKMDGEFNENLETYLKEHPQTTKTEEKKSVTTGFSQGKTANTVVNEKKDYLDKKYANNPYYKK